MKKQSHSRPRRVGTRRQTCLAVAQQGDGNAVAKPKAVLFDVFLICGLAHAKKRHDGGWIRRGVVVAAGRRTTRRRPAAVVAAFVPAVVIPTVLVSAVVSVVLVAMPSLFATR